MIFSSAMIGLLSGRVRRRYFLYRMRIFALQAHLIWMRSFSNPIHGQRFSRARTVPAGAQAGMRAVKGSAAMA
jgi:hypothetical protein